MHPNTFPLREGGLRGIFPISHGLIEKLRKKDISPEPLRHEEKSESDSYCSNVQYRTLMVHEDRAEGYEVEQIMS